MKPPALADWLLRRLVPRHLHADILGDLHEELRRMTLDNHGWLRTRIWYWRQVLVSPLQYRIARRRNSSRRNLAQKRVGRVGVALWIESALADIRYTFRSLRRSPGFTFVAILSLSLGMGANTTLFSLYNALVLRTLPVHNPEELVQVTFGSGRTDFSNPLWEEFDAHQDALSSTFAFGKRTFNLAEGGEVRNVPGYWVSGDFFNVLGVRLVMGRPLANGDDYRGCPGVAVVSYGFWQREFGGAADAVGKTLMLDGVPFEVVGVVDPAFSGVDVGRAIDIYTPLCTVPLVDPGGTWLDARDATFLHVLGRPARGLTTEQASARLTTLAPGIFGATVPELWGSERQQRYRSRTLALRTAPNGLSALRGQYRGALLVLMAAVGVVLLIACANVANLLLARATRRQHEVAVRRALGSGRGRLVRMLVTESTLLSLLSAIVAVVFARWASAFSVRMLSVGSSVWLDLSLDLRVLGFTIAVSTATGILFGLAPAWGATRVAPHAALRIGGRVVSGRHGGFAAGKVLVIGQLAMSLSLVVAAGLLIGTLTRLTTLDTGFIRDGVLLVSVDNRNVGYSSDEARVVNQEVLERIRALPEVRSASAARFTPFDGNLWNNFVEVDGYSPADRMEMLVCLNSTSDGFFATLGTPLLAGRDFDSRDALGSIDVAIVNETMANKFFSEPQPLGSLFRITRPRGAVDTYEVIGVVRDSKYGAIDEEDGPIAYFPLSQAPVPWGIIQYQLRADGAATALIPAVTDLIGDIHPRISVQFSTLADQVAASLTRPKILAVLSGFFGAVALLLAMIGLYGTLAYRVTSRRNEIGLRLALGAARMRVLRMVLGEVGCLVFVGIALGVAGALGGTRLLASFLFGVTATDAPTLVFSAVILVVVSVAAGALPAWHAARLDPIMVLREE